LAYAPHKFGVVPFIELRELDSAKSLREKRTKPILLSQKASPTQDLLRGTVSHITFDEHYAIQKTTYKRSVT